MLCPAFCLHPLLKAQFASRLVEKDRGLEFVPFPGSLPVSLTARNHWNCPISIRIQWCFHAGAFQLGRIIRNWNGQHPTASLLNYRVQCTWMSRSKLVVRISGWCRLNSSIHPPFIGRWRNPLIPALPTTGHPGRREKLCEIFSSELAGVFVPFWRKSFGRWGDPFTSIASVASWQANWFLVKLRDGMGTNGFCRFQLFLT